MTNKQYHAAMLTYTAALKQMNVLLETINEEFALRLKTNPIDHIKSRLKSLQSIAAKLQKKGLDPTWENAEKNIEDIAGIRIICSFTTDIYRIATVIEAQSQLKVLKVKDYIINPKPSGYRSYHMLVEVPVFLSGTIENTLVEIQIRTIAMDFWASLEHKLRYKYENEIPAYFSDELTNCARIIASLDDKMMRLNDEIERT